MALQSTDLAGPIAAVARPHGDPVAATAALRHTLSATGTMSIAEAGELAGQLVRLASIYGNSPFTPLEEARHQLGINRFSFQRLLDLFAGVPALRTAVENGPAGKYWRNTILPLERAGALDAALQHEPVFPRIVGLYPGPTCMFRCHFCVRVTGARYEPSALQAGNAIFSSIIDEMPTDNPNGMYLSGGLEPLTNPGLGALVSRAAARGFKLTLYTNSFALTEQTLERQAGLWSLHAVRTSLYGLNDEEYEATTGKKNAFRRVKANLQRLHKLRAERDEPVQLGMNYLVLPGRAARLSQLIDFIAELNDSAPDYPVNFLTLREDYSGRPDGALSPGERAELQDALNAFEQRALSLTPTLAVDYGYALQALKMGVDAQLIRIRPEAMRPTGHPQVSVQVDLLGDVYLYREAGFPNLTGANRYIAGRVDPGTSLSEVVTRFITSGRQVAPRTGDEYFLDGFDQAITARLNQLEADLAAGWGDARGFLR